MIDIGDVKGALGLAPADTTDEQWLALVVDGVNAYVAGVRPDVADPWPGQIQWGAIQLATRWYSRRNANEISAFTEFGGPPPAIDRDIEAALGIGRFYGPVIA